LNTYILFCDKDDDELEQIYLVHDDGNMTSQQLFVS